MRADSKEFLTSLIWFRTILGCTISHYTIPRSSIGNLSTHREREERKESRLLSAMCPSTVNGRGRKKWPAKEEKEESRRDSLRKQNERKKSILEATKQSSRARVASCKFALVLDSSIYSEAIGASPYKDTERRE